MAQKKKLLPPKFQVWVDARKQFRLSHAHTQMARELGLNPKKLGKFANHDQEQWKAPLPIFIEDLYFKQFERFRLPCLDGGREDVDHPRVMKRKHLMAAEIFGYGHLEASTFFVARLESDGGALSDKERFSREGASEITSG